MATKEKSDVASAAPAAAEPGAFRVSIDEYCTRLSSGDNRVEMIGAFHAQEKSAGRKSDTEAAYKARFIKFCSAPA